MNARTGVERQAQTSREAAGSSAGVFERRTSDDPAGATKAGPNARPKENREHLSPDPMRATDRYRLVMPYSARV